MFAIDAVFLWVDGNDSEHRQLRNTWKAKEKNMHEDAAVEYRYADHGELRYALRSIMLYAPWIRTIHIVTNGQVPQWLDTTHPKVRIVTHDCIFPDNSVLPTFNTHAIEVFMDRIPGLAEHFLAFNDDFFLCAPMTPEMFFPNKGKINIFLSGEKLPEPNDLISETWQSALLNVNMLLNESFGVAERYQPAHNIRPLLRSACKECRIRYGAAVECVSRNRFRAHSDIAFAWCLAPYFAFYRGSGVLSSIITRTVFVSDDMYQVKTDMQNARNVNPVLLCINDATCTNAKAIWSHIMCDLEVYYPNACSLEKVLPQRGVIHWSRSFAQRYLPTNFLCANFCVKYLQKSINGVLRIIAIICKQFEFIVIKNHKSVILKKSP